MKYKSFQKTFMWRHVMMYGSLFTPFVHCFFQDEDNGGLEGQGIFNVTAMSKGNSFARCHYIFPAKVSLGNPLHNIISGTAGGRKFQKEKHIEPIEMKRLWFDVTHLFEELLLASDWLPNQLN